MCALCNADYWQNGSRHAMLISPRIFTLLSWHVFFLRFLRFTPPKSASVPLGTKTSRRKLAHVGIWGPCWPVDQTVDFAPQHMGHLHLADTPRVRVVGELRSQMAKCIWSKIHRTPISQTLQDSEEREGQKTRGKDAFYTEVNINK